MDLKHIADIYGTPLYVYDMEKISLFAGLLKNALPENIGILYSLKANPAVGLVSFIKDQVYGVEVCSEGELFIAMNANVDPQKIIFVGPGKTEEELKYAIESDIFSIVADCFEELEKINRISAQMNKKTSISIRVNPKMAAAGARIKMGGAAKQFGIDEEYLEKFIENASKCSSVKLEGLHVYLGTQISDAGVIVENFRYIFDIARKMQNEYGVALKLIDFGGGFAIPYFPGDKQLDLEVLSKGLAEVFEENRSSFDYSKIRMLVESGRFIMAESGVFLTKVLYKKESRGKTFVITDSGSNHHSSAAGIGRFIRSNFPVEVVNKTADDEKETVDIVGPLCTPTDVLAQNVELPVTGEGDIIAVQKSGAYGLSASMKDFLSHPCSAEVMVRGEKHCLIRKRGKREDFAFGQLKPEIY